MVYETNQAELEDEYRITVSIDKVHVLVENLSVPDSCAINIYKLERDEDGNIVKAYDKKDWNAFICGLIEAGYLD